jgi:MFS family permease
MLSKLTSKFFSQLNIQIWILAIGRLLSSIGTGFTLFYSAIFFVNEVGLSNSAVGWALGSASIAGVFGRILGGAFADSPEWGRKKILLISAIISAVGSFVLAATYDFWSLVLGQVIIGFGVGLYWPATEAVIADITEGENRREAFTITRFFDNLGLGIGIVVGGVLIGITGNYRVLFIIDGISFLVFLYVIWANIRESYQPKENLSTSPKKINSWLQALTNPSFLLYIAINIVFTTYISQLHSTIPIYFKNYITQGNQAIFNETTISLLFTWHLVLSIISQLPVSRAFKGFPHTYALSISASIWGFGFILIWVTGVVGSNQIIWAILALGIFAIALVAYTPSASSLVADLAPESQRGVYLSINSLCWAVGYFIGPPLGGWALDQQRFITDSFWLALAASVVVTAGFLQVLQKALR